MLYFVGAGPGAVDLITVRGAELLKKADIIIYTGSLVNNQVVEEYKKESCLVYNSAGLTLEEVLAIIEASEKKGLLTVRLHTGDPSIYGAIREQMDALEEKNIEFQQVPGVSSFLAAAASLKAEYTLPGVSQTVILTRMAGRTPVPELEDIARLAAHQSTMAIFLSVSFLEDLSRKLIEGGYKKTTKAAIVYKASWPEEIIVRTDIENLAEEAKKHGISKTALILVGDFLGDVYERSELYNPEFTHEYREGVKK